MVRDKIGRKKMVIEKKMVRGKMKKKWLGKKQEKKYGQGSNQKKKNLRAKSKYKIDEKNKIGEGQS